MKYTYPIHLFVKMPALATIFVAYDSARGIAQKGRIPWPRLDKDMEMFAKSTEDHVIIMGRKTWESLPSHPLQKRVNIIITKNQAAYSQIRTFQLFGPGVLTSNDLEQAIATSHSMFPDKRIFVIGGQDIYEEALNKHLVSLVVATEIEAKFSCDRFFPKLGPQFVKSNESQQIQQRLVVENESEREKAPIIKYKVVEYKLVQNPFEMNYLQLMNSILMSNIEKDDRTGSGTIMTWGAQLRFPLNERFPLLTTKKMFLRGVFEELKWFLSGKTNINALTEAGVHIWDHNSSREYLDSRGLKDYPIGEVGPLYGYQWVHFNKPYAPPASSDAGKTASKEDGAASVTTEGTPTSGDAGNAGDLNQLKNAIEMIKNDPTSRRIVVCAWNPLQIDQMALPPCHMLYQFAVIKKKLFCRVDMRSADLFLGVPFNIASYALLTTIVARICNLELGDLVLQMGDVHIYKNHIQACLKQIERTALQFPTLDITKPLDCLDDVASLNWEDIKLNEYVHHASISTSLN